MSDVTRYMWTATGLRPSEIEHGPVRFIRETDYDALRAQLDEEREACARLCEEHKALRLSEIIRARGEK